MRHQKNNIYKLIAFHIIGATFTILLIMICFALINQLWLLNLGGF
mgnify:CR=1 FL=1